MLCAVSLGNPRLKGGIALISMASREYKYEAFGIFAVRQYNFSGASFGMISGLQIPCAVLVNQLSHLGPDKVAR
jgi:hypothetical protein